MSETRRGDACVRKADCAETLALKLSGSVCSTNKNHKQRSKHYVGSELDSKQLSHELLIAGSSLLSLELEIKNEMFVSVSLVSHLSPYCCRDDPV